MDPLFRVRLNCVDHYQAVPLNQFDPPVPRSSAAEATKERPRISVIRVFGATETGQKVLMHIHGALQYTFVEYSGSLVEEDVNNAIRSLHLSIDHALAVSYRKNVYDGKNKYVAHISLVKGTPFYGYHVGYKFYLKIYLLNPLHMTRLADLLREGAVMKKVLQPFESHMQYIAQWMCDYSLYGCSYIDCKKVKFRSPIPNFFELDNFAHHWHDQSILPNMLSDEASLPKQSHCALEVDVCVQDIINRQNIEARPLHHDFIERIHPLPEGIKLVQSMAGLWKDETRRRKARMGLTDPNSSPFPADVLITMSADLRNTEAGGWIHEQEFRDKLAEIAAQERADEDKPTSSFDNFVKSTASESPIQTVLESVEDLYPSNMQKLILQENLGITNYTSGLHIDGQPPLDETFISDYSANSDRQDSAQVSSKDSHDIHYDLTTSSVHESSHSTIRSPVSSGEFIRFGIGSASDMDHFQEDAFEIPRPYLAERRPKPHLKKRARTLQIAESKSEQFKRQKLEILPEEVERYDTIESIQGIRSGIAAELQVFDGNHFDFDEQELEDTDFRLAEDEMLTSRTVQSKSQEKAHKTVPSSSQNSILNFPVVKNPNDPNTIVRLSQHSESSQKLIENRNSKLQSRSPNFSTSMNSEKQLWQSFGHNQSSTPSSPTIHLFFGSLLPPRQNRSLKLFSMQAPRSEHIKSTMSKAGLPDRIYREAHYSKEEDVPDRQREYAGREFKLESITVPFLPDFDPSGTSLATHGRKVPILIDRAVEEVADHQRRKRCRRKHWNIAATPPRKVDVINWLKVQSESATSNTRGSVDNLQITQSSQITGPTQRNKYGFKYSQKQASTSVQHETQYMSLMSLEVHVNTRGSLTPNPEEDPIACIFWCVQTDDEDIEVNTIKDGMHAGILMVAEQPNMAKRIARNIAIEVEEEASELEVLTKMIDIVRLYDPDILTGYEVHNSSWGYLIERARLKYDLNFCDEISRMKSQSHGRFGKDDDKWGFNHTSTIRVTGRHTINIWRAMRGELNLLQYTMENVVFHLLHQRIPHYSFADLTKWYKSKNPRDLAKVIEYFSSRVQIDLEILEANELVPRTSEQARLIGVDWFSVISRGSQFKVENIMFRIAKPENFLLVSPSRRQVGGQNALECLPLVMEPQSDFYSSPMLVLDFQSLYPSVMIAYNYCYSTFLGRVVGWRGTNKMGFTNYQRQHKLIDLLKDHINIAPNGIMYAKTEIRKSLLAKMLSEILETRVMVKSGMKVDKDDKTLQHLLNNRQLALKLIANVTYGYTSASFSGRMPCSEIADSIVQTGRETLEKAIAFIHSVERWGAEVVYGDTDSLFVYLKGRTREQAFDIGEDIAKSITDMNPRPVKLKFEKVYHPCVLLAKKRYVGFKYEHRNQKEPEFEAKGIETVRRDGTPAEQKIEENALKVLFRTADLSQVKSFFQAQCTKIMKGKVSIQDFCFAKEVRLGTYSDKGPPPPGALISARRMLEDPRLEPQYGERVPYVVVTGGPQARLIDRCVAPEVLLHDAQQELDAEYYISKNIIPPLERIFNLVGANVRQWYDEMPKYQRIRRVEASIANAGNDGNVFKKTLESYMKSSTCIVCRETLDSKLPICSSCRTQAPQSLLFLRAKLVKSERKSAQLAKVCRSCSGIGWKEEIKCDSKDCPVFYSRSRQGSALANTKAYLSPVLQVLEDQIDEDIAW